MRLALAFQAALCFAFCFALGSARPAGAQDVAPEAELLHGRVEQIQADPELEIAGGRIAARDLIAELYARRGFARAWTSPAASDDLLRAIRDSEGDGLDPRDYLLEPLESARAEAESPGAAAEARIDYDLLQTEALTRLLYHLIFGKVDPRSFDPTWNFTREVHLGDPATFVQSAIESGELYARIEREKPQHDLYRNLKAELARQRAIAASGGWPALAAGSTLKPGASDPRVRGLRARLAASGELDTGAPLDSPDYDDALAQAVKAFQSSHGLDGDGAVGPGTLAALNVPVAARIETLRINLERGRWLLHDLAPTFVIVNVAGFEVYYLRDGKLVWSARAQVGKPYRSTPIFRSTMTYLVLNPTWTVPPGIFANDILPAQKRDRSTLAKKRLEVVDAKGRTIPASSIDWATVTPRSFRYMLRQQPGPDNALGRVKFMFPNPYSVYLHDTPSKVLFEKSERAFSSGCIRVEKPFELAELLLDDPAKWSRAEIERVVETGKLRSVTLAKPAPVLLSYWTAWVDRSGVLQLRPDLYGRDAKVAAGLDARFRFRPRDGARGDRG